MSRASTALAITALVAAAVYAATPTYGFVWDDSFLILNNRYMRSWSELAENLTSDFFRKSRDEGAIGYWRPVVTLSYMVDRALFEDRAWGFHLVNVILHAVASCLVLLLAWKLPLSRAVALGSALLFAVHPAHVESVAWISGRTDLWCALFALAALWLDLEAAQRRSRGLRAASLAAAALALLSKEMAAVLPAMIAARVLLLPPPEPGLPGARRAWRARAGKAARTALPYALVVAAYLAVRFGILGIETHVPAAAEAGRRVLFLTWWNALLEYLRVLVWPALLTVEHQFGLVRTIASPPVALGMLALGGMIFAAWRVRLREPGLAYAIVLLLVGLVPLTNFVVPINAPPSYVFPWSERFLYLPSVGFCIAAAWLVLEGLPRLVTQRGAQRGASARGARAPRWAVAILAVLSVAAAARTVARARDWKDDLSLFGAAVLLAPKSSLAHLNFGVALADAGRLDEAERQYRIALPLATTPHKIHYNLGNVYRARGDRARAEAEYRRSLAARPVFPPARLNLGLVLLETGRIEEALACFTRADESLPGYVEAKVNRANVLRLLHRGQESLPLYEEALRIEPGMTAARIGLAGALYETGRTDQAEALVRELISQEPDLVEARLLLARQLDRAGRTAEAEREYREVLRLQPGNVVARRRVLP